VTTLWPPRAWAAAAATLTAIAIAVVAEAASANQILIGVNSVRFAWTAASGGPTGYQVYRSLNGGALAPYSVALGTGVEISVAPGDQIAIAVVAVAKDSSGRLRAGPMSPLSERIWATPSPKFPVTGSWVLRCATCPALARRSLTDASVVRAQAPALAAPWRVLGRAALVFGRKQIVWHNTQTGELALWDEGTLAPIPGGVGLGSPAMRGVGGADFNRDGIEEFVIQRTDTGVVSLWSLTPNGFERTVSLTGPPGARLAAARDMNGDGRIELLWQNSAAGTLDSWTLKGDPRTTPLSTLYESVKPRLAAGVAPDAIVASTGDYDGDGYVDVLWRFPSGGLGITYLPKGKPPSFVPLPAVAGDANRIVVGSLNIDGVRDDEIALQDWTTGRISILNPSASGAPRTNVVDPGSAWKVIGIGS